MANPKKRENKTVAAAFKEAGITPPKKPIAVSLDDLHVDPNYQRAARENRVNRFAKNFDPIICGVLVVSQRPSGKLFIIDGNHRRNVLQKLGFNHWPAHVITGLSSAAEAEIYDKLNTERSNATSAERFKARLHYKDPVAVTIRDIVHACGYRIVLENYGRRDGRTIHAVSTLDSIFRKSNQPGLQGTLELIASCWDEDEPGCTDSITLKGIHLVLSHKAWRERVNIEHLRKRLAAIPVSKLLRKARAFHETTGQNHVHLFAEAVVVENNKRLKKKSKNYLPPRGMLDDEE